MSTTSAFPSALDAFTAPSATDDLDDLVGGLLHPEHHEQLQNCIAAVQARIGITGSTVAGTLDWLLRAVQPVAVSGSKTLALSDAGQHQDVSSGSAVVVTIPTNASVAFPVGTCIPVNWIGAGTVTITAAGGVDLNGVTAGSVAISAQYKGVLLRKLAADAWLAIGAL